MNLCQSLHSNCGIFSCIEGNVMCPNLLFQVCNNQYCTFIKCFLGPMPGRMVDSRDAAVIQIKAHIWTNTLVLVSIYRYSADLYDSYSFPFCSVLAQLCLWLKWVLLVENCLFLHFLIINFSHFYLIFSGTIGSILGKHHTKCPWVKGILILCKWGSMSFSKGR